MRLLPTTPALPLLALALCAAPAPAQRPHRYVRLSLGAAQLQPPGRGFPLDPAIHPALGVGYAFRGGHRVELSAARLAAETTGPSSPGREAPYTIGVRATPLELAYEHRLPLPAGRVHPLAGVAALWAPVTDTWASDTPRERRRSSVLGVSPSLGLAVRLARGASMAARGGYRYTVDADDRYARAIGLSGFRLDTGLLLAW